MESTEQVTVSVSRGSDGGYEMTDIMNADSQRRLHDENQRAIDQLRSRLDTVIAQNEAQTAALRIIVGCPISDTEALMKFRDEHRRFQRYDQRISEASETLIRWIMRLILVGAIAFMVVGMSFAGVFDALRSLTKGG